MQVDFNSIKPIYLQIAEAIEDDIITGSLAEGAPAYSQLILAKELGVNPATAAKGINVLVQNGTLTRERGKSMTVADGAKSRLITNRQKNGLSCLVSELVTEARKIELTKKEILSMVDEYYSRNGKGAMS
ncbi:MAG: GntR family transcriptional regulator [Coriobacteriia bacterium]|nr:GntR family transcriptional regulator [Coriobacteriia bacterium]MCL2537504.1 GntR family transcriptional regulator [Coriobacteriia bacterium]